MSSYISADLRRLVALRARGLCEYCLIHEADTYLGCQVDHVISEKHGGPTEADNLAYACTLCNRAGGSDIGSIASSTGELTRLFNPRTDRWLDHFALVKTIIQPRSPIGEATVSSPLKKAHRWHMLASNSSGKTQLAVLAKSTFSTGC
jgi:hypothetical protein